MDQANKLRDMFQTHIEKPRLGRQLSARVITVTSGKGGVGKTNCAVNLAIHMQNQGQRVVIIDADFGLANIEILLGIVPRHSLADVLNGEKAVTDVLTSGPNGVQFISGGSGLRELANLSDRQMAYLLESFTVLDNLADIIIIDTGAGISKSVINFVRASNEAIIVTTPEPTAVTDAYALVKMIKFENSDLPSVKVIVNRTDEANEGHEVFEKLNKVSTRFLSMPLEFLGSIPFDRNLVRAVKRQQPAAISYPTSSFTMAIGQVGDQLLDLPPKQAKSGGLLSFMKRLVGSR